MSDEEARRRERSGDPLELGRVLADKVRRGEMDDLGLRAAARIGDEAALVALAQAEKRSVTSEFLEQHGERLRAVHALLRSGLREGWRAEATPTLLAALAAAAGHEDLARRIIELSREVTCPGCDTRFVPLGEFQGGEPTPPE